MWSICLPINTNYVSLAERDALAASCLWDVDVGWSEQASILREKVLQTMQPLSYDFVIEHLKHLRLVDKKVISFACSYWLS